MRLPLFLLVSFLLFFSACSAPTPPAVKVEATSIQVDYLKDVKPILDKRCVTCHSCYNSPCQAKYSSFEGVDRGASKLKVYNATRLSAVEPTRLFVDAKSTEVWRDKGFYSLTYSKDSNKTHNDSIMMHLLYDKKEHPELIGDYSPETDALLCPRNKEELGEYLEDKPNHGMPYGLPALEKKEYLTLAQWLQQGAKGPSTEEVEVLERPSKHATKEIQKWETFFNESDVKHQVTARYLYEHLYLGHIYFENSDREFFELVRSYTPPGYPIEVIPTVRVFDDPLVDTFYYRLDKIRSTIVHKTHMTLKFDDRVLSRFNELFIQVKWMSEPELISYDIEVTANPLLAYAQIPADSRYKFLLDNSEYIIRNFIRGPVCRGQIALSVIHDHFWVMFKDPKYDITVTHPEFLDSQRNNLALPIHNVNKSLFSTFSDDYKNRYVKYFDAKEALSQKVYPKGEALDSIWKGNSSLDTPLLTIYRHFDSASVHKGVLGEEPRTMWVMDFAQLEKIYYTLVAGFNIYGNISHQTRIRRYMDFLRMEGELNFINYMPQKKRFTMLQSWYIGSFNADRVKKLKSLYEPTAIVYTSDTPKREFITKVVNEHILKSTGIKFDYVNYTKTGDTPPVMPKVFHSREDFLEGVKSITQAGSGFIKYMTDSQANNIFLRLDMPDGTFITRNLVINRWHDNVNSLFNGESVLNADKDTMDVIKGQVSSYPNVFVVVKLDDLGDFLRLIKNMKGTQEDFKRLRKYFISRSDKDFWKIFDWFTKEQLKKDPINAGLLDLNRYARQYWDKP
ncbi:fatty acid cis/trans isomerase [Sulfurimonas sp. SAG-AH-194-C21]|nr:fatty acid cis/trans isomerase [Sulfurimonas sp. SAG-AH-194-C21]MDF1883143.1 fatty acid cis/trans isomerase [Sulfurimonas sp. SAG-AH-194-C21]